jgi:hypothetical protein
MSIKNESRADGFSFSGKTVNCHFLPGQPMFVSHGEFNIRNETGSDKEILITKCWLIRDEVKSLLEHFHIYKENTAMSNPFRVKAKSSFDFRITFPFQPVESGRNQCSLLIRVKYNDQIIEAQSEIVVFEERAK